MNVSVAINRLEAIQEELVAIYLSLNGTGYQDDSLVQAVDLLRETSRKLKQYTRFDSYGIDPQTSRN